MTNTSDPVAAGFWVEARLPSGRTVMVRSMDQAGGAGDEDEGIVQDVRYRSIDFKVFTATLNEIGELVSSAIRPLAPHEAEVELGLGFNASTGQMLVLFGTAAAQSSMKVNLRWRFAPEADHDQEA